MIATVQCDGCERDLRYESPRMEPDDVDERCQCRYANCGAVLCEDCFAKHEHCKNKNCGAVMTAYEVEGKTRYTCELC